MAHTGDVPMSLWGDRRPTAEDRWNVEFGPGWQPPRWTREKSRSAVFVLAIMAGATGIGGLVGYVTHNVLAGLAIGVISIAFVPMLLLTLVAVIRRDASVFMWSPSWLRRLVPAEEAGAGGGTDPRPDEQGDPVVKGNPPA
jgi:hypothetical protein